MTAGAQEAQGQRTEAPASRYRAMSTESPWDALRDCLAEMNKAGIPLGEQNAMVADGLRDLARRAVDFHRIYGGE